MFSVIISVLLLPAVGMAQYRSPGDYQSGGASNDQTPPTKYRNAPGSSTRQYKSPPNKRTTLQQQLTTHTKQLTTIQEKTLNNNPKIMAKHQELAKLVFDTMSESGYNPDKDIATMKKIQSDIQKPNLSKAEKQELFQRFKHTQQNLDRAENRAYATPKVQAKTAEVHRLTLDTMKKDYPETEALLAKIQRIRSQLQNGR